MRINLALQGGGAIGALTWGVLDRLLEEPDVSFEAISGTSAGAMNAVALAHGLYSGGADGAKETLEAFWTEIGETGLSLPLTVPTVPYGPSASRVFLHFTRFLSPYQFNPLGLNPLRTIVERSFDFPRLNEGPIKLFIGATHVRTGSLKLFTHRELDPARLLASACLPAINHAIEIDGESYWDGGYTANPALYPLVYECEGQDILAILLQPLNRPRTPTAAETIRSRIAEIHLNASFLQEMRGLMLARAEASRSRFPMGRLERRLRELRFHVIDADDLTSSLNAEKALNVHPRFLRQLKEEGRHRAEEWLRRHSSAVGHRSTVDLASLVG